MWSVLARIRHLPLSNANCILVFISVSLYPLYLGFCLTLRMIYVSFPVLLLFIHVMCIVVSPLTTPANIARSYFYTSIICTAI
jgi:hypothetical protein